MSNPGELKLGPFCFYNCQVPFGSTQPTVEVAPGHYACPQCGHEIKENDPAFRCRCELCRKSAP